MGAGEDCAARRCFQLIRRAHAALFQGTSLDILIFFGDCVVAFYWAEWSMDRTGERDRYSSIKIAHILEKKEIAKEVEFIFQTHTLARLTAFARALVAALSQTFGCLACPARQIYVLPKYWFYGWPIIVDMPAPLTARR